MEGAEAKWEKKVAVEDWGVVAAELEDFDCVRQNLDLCQKQKGLEETVVWLQHLDEVMLDLDMSQVGLGEGTVDLVQKETGEG